MRFHGIPVYSKRIVFILDLSGSMKDEILVEVPDPKRSGLVKKINRTKMEVSKEELIRTINSLGPKVYFNVIFFGTKITPWQKRMVLAAGRNKKTCEVFVKKQKCLGRTNIYDSIEFALNDPNADTVFLLSDGGPSEGKYMFKSRVLRKVWRLNKYQLVRINTLMFGETEAKKSAVWFMKELAEDNWGKYYPKY